MKEIIIIILSFLLTVILFALIYGAVLRHGERLFSEAIASTPFSLFHSEVERFGVSLWS